MTLTIGILGASGFVGNRAVEMLCLEGDYLVRPIVRNPSSLERFTRFDLKGHVADALDQSALYEAFSGCDIVIHSVIGSPSLIRQTVVSTYQAAQQAKVRRLVYMSTACVHSQAPSPGTDENSPLSDRQPISYNNAKVQAERKLLQLRAQGSTEVVILRPLIVFGPRDPRIAGFANALSEGTAYVVNEGKGICNTVYVDNLVHAIRLAMSAPKADRQAFLVSDREQVTWADLYRPIAEALGYDFSQIPNVEMPYIDSAELTLTWKESLLEKLRNSELVNVARALIPAKSKQALAGAVKKSLESTTVTPEKALLYLCQYKLPNQKAQKILGYEPIVSFPEACHQTIKWLATEGFPVQADKL